MLAFPLHPDWHGYHEPLSAMPEAAKELFRYDPGKARQLLAEAGYPNGFTFKVQVCACTPVAVELLSMVAGYLEAVKVKLDIQVMEYGAHLSVMNNNTNAAGYFYTSGLANPFTTTRVSFVSHTYNPAQWNDPAFAEKFAEAAKERDETRRTALFREMMRDIIIAAPYIWLPAPYYYTAWWPWVKNYNGELRAGAARPGPIYARIWIDQDLKKRMGY
jgi:peptide/nickel transport system substrate-binding protein